MEQTGQISKKSLSAGLACIATAVALFTLRIRTQDLPFLPCTSHLFQLLGSRCINTLPHQLHRWCFAIHAAHGLLSTNISHIIPPQGNYSCSPLGSSMKCALLAILRTNRGKEMGKLAQIMNGGSLVAATKASNTVLALAATRVAIGSSHLT